VFPSPMLGCCLCEPFLPSKAMLGLEKGICREKPQDLEILSMPVALNWHFARSEAM
jgi:hypothetical protein